jgi:4a-hydroxytetrahydrobiopterin dehydratase
MPGLTDLNCVACGADAPRVSSAEAKQMMSNIPEWSIAERDGIMRLERAYSFQDFKSAWAFTDRVAELAESQGHHPSILLEWGKVSLSWWSHAIRGLHMNDFICAAKSDELMQEQ